MFKLIRLPQMRRIADDLPGLPSACCPRPLQRHKHYSKMATASA